jgi:micrococcal nuclease
MFEYTIKEVVKVIDGDTVDVFIDLGFNVFHVERLRLNRVDAPETLTKDKNEKKYGMEAKSFVSNWLKEQKQIKIQTFKDDKYGRILAEFIGDGDICLNDLLLNEGYAWPYDGNAKITDLTLLEAKRKPKS